MIALDQLTADHLRPQIDTAFGVDLGEQGTVELTLLTVETLGGSPSTGAGAARQPFSIELRGPDAPLLPQATYPLAHAELGTLPLFLVPIARDPEGLRYQAIVA